ncbi:sulfite exporter TauE/SafE family protein [Vibrio ruber]|uniref:Probable membrane transporter protein n=2 Tax=Vibrio ruber TaxID=184755 RepID=A0A1R4LP83_VIBR1|nr:sulfite exporter TauE/SafE family protein [Vibrio ruber]WNJ97315.1 sulfite exporter TauE/SafE family protein [Vibrio ruber]SJN58147.1 Sulfite exporter TauE/SafE [Vibrio ruber DSM 16370]
MVAATIGFGGGMLLIVVFPSFLSPSLIIPAYGVVQLASNISRMLFSLKYVRWKLLPKFLIGSVIGALFIGYGLSHISMDYVPAAIGLYILLNLWSSKFSALVGRYESYYVIGFLQTGLGLVVGATGPLALNVLTKQLKSKDEIIATSALFMTISHMAKIPVYLSVTASLFTELNLIIYMIIGSILGSFLGTKLRLRTNNDKMIKIIKVLLTLFAIKMIGGVMI